MALLKPRCHSYSRQLRQSPSACIPYKANYAVFLYLRNITSCSYDYLTTMTCHYVTITGIVINNNAEEQDSVYLRIQSWGGEYYLNRTTVKSVVPYPGIILV